MAQLTLRISVVKAVTAVALLTSSLRTGQAAEKIDWAGFQAKYREYESCRHITPCEEDDHRYLKIVTLDGRKHSGRRLTFQADALTLNDFSKTEEFARRDISRIEIRERGRYLHHTAASARAATEVLLFFSPGGISEPMEIPLLLLTTAISAPVWAYTAVSAPVTVSAEAVHLLVRPHVYKLTP